jgi:hypothetical protein
MNNYEVAPWVAAVVIVLTVWRAFHGPYSDEWSSSTKGFFRARLSRKEG